MFLKIATTCNNHNNITDEKRNAYTDKIVKGVDTGSLWDTDYNEFYTDFQDIIKKSYWQGKKFDSTAAFVNHLSDSGLSFTFNPGNDFLKLLQKNRIGIKVIKNFS